MNLSYVFNHDQAKCAQLDTLGYDLETFLLVFKDAFALVSEFGYSNKEAAEFLFRLKNAYDAAQGKPVDATASLYDAANSTYPNRLSVENKATNATFFFRLVPGQSRGDKNQILYRCELCAGGEPIKRIDVKQHILDKHEATMQVDS